MEPYDFGSTTDLNRLANAYVALPQKNRLTVMTAESCTGGTLSAKLVDIPGVSEMLQEGYITYPNRAKRRLSNVSKATLKRYGVVSAQIAREMAIGVVFVASADIAALITGIAGSGGGDDEKPVGLVLIGCYMSDRVTVEEHHFQGDYITVRTQAVQGVLRPLRATVLENTKT